MPAPALVWFRQDLRLSDNPALMAAARGGRPIIAVYVLDQGPGIRPMGGASLWWLHHSLSALERALGAMGGKLYLARGDARAIIPALARQWGAEAVHWNRCYEPYAIARDKEIKSRLQADGKQVESHNGSLLFEPWEVRPDGSAYRVFSPFWRACLSLGPPPAPLPRPEGPVFFDIDDGQPLTEWDLLPTKPDWAGGLRAGWTPGEWGAQKRLESFLQDGFHRYAGGRDIPSQANTSYLSPHLHFGEISPRQIWHATQHAAAQDQPQAHANAAKFLSEVGWREFSYHLLYHFPHLPERNYRPEFDHFPWADDEVAWQAWTKGRTGIPIVDAGLRELWATGWMHNRVRMIAASFLVKHCLIPWQKGEAWFWDTLVDADLANNAASWQWVAGSGADAAPYFRIFNPVLQGEKFDPEGDYVRRWVPELVALPQRFIHKPWEAGPLALREAGIELGRDYPLPLIDLDRGRARALAAFQSLKSETL